MDNSEQERTKVMAVVESVIPEWKGLNHNDVKIERMTGITNQTYKVSHPQANTPLIYRKFGDAQQNLFLDRESERFVYEHISQQKLGPKIYGYADMIRLESFIESKVLQSKDMLAQNYIERVAFALRAFHGMTPPENIVKKSLFQRAFYSQPDNIINKCLKKLNQDIFSEKEKENVEILRKWVTSDEINFLQEATKALSQEPLVFSHNDLLANNVLLREKDGKVIFIDYQYSCFNYRVYDIANYFNETQYDYDVTTEPYFGVIEPSPKTEKDKQYFIKLYCFAEGKTYPEYKSHLQKGQLELSEDQDKLFESIKGNLKLGQMLSNVMWGWWAIIVCKNMDINFDYIEFAMKRYRDYLRVKQGIMG